MGIANITNNILTDSGAVIGSANGVATLDSSGKIPVAQLPNSVMEFKGMWSAATNTPTLVNGTGNAGDVYEVSAAGTVNFGAGGISFSIGDYVLYDGATWQFSSGQKGTITSLTFSSPLTGGTITTSGTVSIPLATGLVNGYLSSTDWSSFNAKQAALNGTGFVKISGTTISYDNSTYYLASNPNGYTTNVGTVTSVGLSSATSGVTIGSTPVTTSGTITLAIATASGSQQGLLSSTDWTTFNNKANSVAGGYLPLSGGTLTGALSGTSATFSGTLSLGSNAGNSSRLQYNYYSGNADSRSWRTSIDNNVYGDFSIQKETAQGNNSYSNILIFSPSGAATFSSSVTATSFIGAGSSLTSLPSNTALYPTLNQNTSGNAATATLAANSTLWNSYSVNLSTYGTNAGDFLNYDNTENKIKPFSTAQIQTKLGLLSSNWVDLTTTQSIGGAKTFSGQVALNNGALVPNGIFLQMKRNTGSASVNVLGFESGTDDLVQVFSNSWKLRNTGTGDAANVIVANVDKSVIFSGALTGTSARFSSPYYSPSTYYGANPNINLVSTSAAGIGVGGNIAFVGQTGNSTAQYTFANIVGGKAGASGDDGYEGRIYFYTTNSSSTVSVKATLDQSYGFTLGSTVGVGSVNLYAGAATFTGALTGTSATFSSSVTASGGGFDSDETLKNILTVGVCYGSIADTLDLISYTWKDENKGKVTRWGYSAQKLQKLMPETVYQNGATLAVDYTQVHSVIIDEHTRRIQKLERELEQLKSMA